MEQRRDCWILQRPGSRKISAGTKGAEAGAQKARGVSGNVVGEVEAAIALRPSLYWQIYEHISGATQI